MQDMPKVGDICWYELSTPDLEKAKEFYGKSFGWKFTDHDMGDMKYSMIKINDKEFGGVWAIPKDQTKQIPPHWMAYILVENLDDAVKKVTAQGASIMKPATQVSDFGRFAIITDPTGAHIALWQNLKNC